MLRKALAAGFLIALCLGFLAVEGSSQAPPPVAPSSADSTPASPGPQPPSPFIAPQQTEPSFAELVQQLKNVRAQQEALKEQERRLLEKLVQKVELQRQELQKAEQLLQQLRQSPTPRSPEMPEKDTDKGFPIRKDKGIP
jgi:hypothetical protein